MLGCLVILVISRQMYCNKQYNHKGFMKIFFTIGINVTFATHGNSWRTAGKAAYIIKNQPIAILQGGGSESAIPKFNYQW